MERTPLLTSERSNQQFLGTSVLRRQQAPRLMRPSSFFDSTALVPPSYVYRHTGLSIFIPIFFHPAWPLAIAPAAI